MSEAIRLAWENITAHPDQLTDMGEKRVLYAAGGGLPLQFGNEESVIWQGIVKAAVNDHITIAGVEFSIDELKRLGNFYRGLRDKGYVFHCIDERLKGDLDHLKHQVHLTCGACNATGAATGMEGVEDTLQGELDEDQKQPVYPDMHHHESLVISVDLTGAHVAQGELRESLKEKEALAFNVSIPLDEVTEDLIKPLVKWNVHIARNIIGGDHNGLKDHANETLLLVIGDPNHTLYPLVMAALNHVAHQDTLTIS